MIDAILEAFNGLVRTLATAWEYIKDLKELFK